MQLFIPLIAILSGLAALAMGNGLLSLVIPTTALHRGFTPFGVGLLSAGYYFGFLCGCFLTPLLVKRSGHVRTFMAMAAAASTAALSYHLIFGLTAWICLRSISGFATAAIYMITECWLNEQASNETRGRILSVYRLVELGALMCGQLLIGHFNEASPPTFIVASMLINLGLIPVAISNAQAPQPIHTAKIDLHRLFFLSPISFMACLGVGLANGPLWGLGPVYASQSGFSLPDISFFMVTFVLSGAITQMAVGYLSDKFSRLYLLGLMSLGASLAGLALTMAFQGDKTLISALAFCYGSAALPLYSIVIAIINDTANSKEYLKISGGLLITYSIGAASGALIASSSMSYLGGRALFIFTMSIHFLLSMLCFYGATLKVRGKKKTHHQEIQTQTLSSL